MGVDHEEMIDFRGNEGNNKKATPIVKPHRKAHTNVRSSDIRTMFKPQESRSRKGSSSTRILIRINRDNFFDPPLCFL